MGEIVHISKARCWLIQLVLRKNILEPSSLTLNASLPFSPYLLHTQYSKLCTTRIVNPVSQGKTNGYHC